MTKNKLLLHIIDTTYGTRSLERSDPPLISQATSIGSLCFNIGAGILLLSVFLAVIS